MFHRNIKILLIPVSLIIVFIVIFAYHAKKPTAVVIDDQTGKPIEGAVAIAIWRGSVSGYSWFEGGMEKPIRIEERKTDRDGKFYISGYWNWHLKNDSYPELNVYKFGYVLWDQKTIFMDGRRTDFNKKTRLIRMRKWPEEFSFDKHYFFINSCTRGDHSDWFKFSLPGYFIKEIEKESTYISEEFDKKYKVNKEYYDDYYFGIHVRNLFKPVYYKGKIVPEEPGAFVDSVSSASPIFGIIKSNDVITRINNTDISNIKDLANAVKGIKERDSIQIAVLRHHKIMDFKIELKEFYWKIDNRIQTQAINEYPELIKKWEEQGGKTNINIPKPAPPALPKYTK
jgi:hypothetical protein